MHLVRLKANVRDTRGSVCYVLVCRQKRLSVIQLVEGAMTDVCLDLPTLCQKSGVVGSISSPAVYYSQCNLSIEKIALFVIDN